MTRGEQRACGDANWNIIGAWFVMKDVTSRLIPTLPRLERHEAMLSQARSCPTLNALPLTF